MRKAAVLLKQKVYAVQEVAEMVGYNDIPTFWKHFVDAFGTTPSTYANSTDNSWFSIKIITFARENL